MVTTKLEELIRFTNNEFNRESNLSVRKLMHLLKEATDEKSVAKKRKVGALIYNIQTAKFEVFEVNSNPYNSGCCESENGETFESVEHAESKAIFKLMYNLIYIQNNPGIYEMYVTYSPCYNCTKEIIKSNLFSSIIIDDVHPNNFTKPDKIGGISCYEMLLNDNINVTFLADIKYEKLNNCKNCYANSNCKKWNELMNNIYKLIDDYENSEEESQENSEEESQENSQKDSDENLKEKSKEDSQENLFEIVFVNSNSKNEYVLVCKYERRNNTKIGIKRIVQNFLQYLKKCKHHHVYIGSQHFIDNIFIEIKDMYKTS